MKEPIQSPRNTRLPLYARIRADILQAMQSGALQPGNRAPSERELTQRYQVSRMTARHALSSLEAEGYLTRSPGKGTFVSQPKFEQTLQAVTSFTEDMQRRGLVPEGRTLATAILAADQRMSDRMGLQPGAPVVQIQRLRLANGTPMALETSTLPLGRFPDLAQLNLEANSLYRILQERYGVEPAKATQSIEAILAGTFEADLLQVKVGAPLLLLERFTRDDSGRVIEYVRSFYRGDRYRLLTELRTQPEQ